MLREMVKKEQMLSEEETINIIKSQNYGVLSVYGDEGFPYGIPINYIFQDGKFIIHGTNGKSHKMDSLIRNNKVCLTIVDDHELDPEEYTTKYSSVIVFGFAAILKTDEEKREAITSMVKELAPTALTKVQNHCVRDSSGYSIIVITPCHVTGKVSR